MKLHGALLIIALFLFLVLSNISERKSASVSVSTTPKAESMIIPGIAEYRVRIVIGSPPQARMVVFDTGSSLTWVQCQLCDRCFDEDTPIFNPMNSVTYKVLSYYDKICGTFKDITSRGPNTDCRYNMRYLDESKSIGNLAWENIGFTDFGSTPVVMGCARNTTGSFNPGESGIGGFGRSKLSLISQLDYGQVFSYCLAPIHSKLPSRLTIGINSTLSTGSGRVSTPLLADRDFYVVSLDGISVTNRPGPVRIVPPKTHQMIIDSGTTFTFLNDLFYDLVAAEVESKVYKGAIDNPPNPFRLCYSNIWLGDLPDINFHLGGGDKIEYHSYQMFYRVKDLYCLVILPHPYNVTLFGNTAQVNYRQEYDLVQGKVTFQSENCGADYQ